MEYHYSLLRTLDINPDTAPALVEITNDKWHLPHATRSAAPLSQVTYQNIVLHFIEKHMMSDEISLIRDGFTRSPVSTEALYKDFFKMDQPIVDLLQDSNFSEAFGLVQNAFRPRKKIHILHYADTRLYPWPLNTNVELPFSHDQRVNEYLDSKFKAGDISDRKKNLHNLYDYVYDAVRYPIHRIKDGLCFTGNFEKDYIYPITAHIRPGLAKTDRASKIKNRLVCGVSKVQLIPENMFAYPLFREYQESGLSPLLWGYETILGGWKKLRNEMEPQLPTRYFIISGDWSEFDHRVLFTLMELVFIGDMSYYDWTEYQSTHEYPHCPFEPDRLVNLYMWLIYATFSSPLLMPDNKLWMRTRNGLPSGMFRTQYIDSKINAIMLVTILLDAGFVIDISKFLKLLGDDNIIVIWRYLPPDQYLPLLDFLSDRAMLRFNAKLSREATEIHHSFDFVELLGYRNFCGYPYRDTLKLLAQMLYPESDSYELNALKGRTIGIAYASLARDPRLMSVCKDIHDYLDSQGVSVKKSAFIRMFDPNLTRDPTFEPDHFPTLLEIQKWTSMPYSKTQIDFDRYWPSNHFIDIKDPIDQISLMLDNMMLI